VRERGNTRHPVPHPLIYEINAWVWLGELGSRTWTLTDLFTSEVYERELGGEGLYVELAPWGYHFLKYR
jgi:hypothetical protein